MKVAIYNANLHTMGGGEKYAGVIAELLAENNTVDILCTIPIDLDKFNSKLNLNLNQVNIVPINEVNDGIKFEIESEKYDLFINITYFSKLKSRCKNSVLILFFPLIEPHKYPIWIKRFIYSILKNTFFKNQTKTSSPILNRLFDSQKNFFTKKEYLNTYKSFIGISKYTQEWIKKELNVESTLLYPPIDIKDFKPVNKKNIILSVGRFFIHSHNKKQLELIKIFKDMYDSNNEVKHYEYHLCGSVQNDKESQDYVNLCMKEAEGYPIYIHTDISHSDLQELYLNAKIFWHATGLKEDIKRNPDRFEHFGITTVEAMAQGVVPVVINKAGQTEVVKDGEDGFLWNNIDELKAKTILLMKDNILLNKLSLSAIKSSKFYSKDNMRNKIKQIFNL